MFRRFRRGTAAALAAAMLMGVTAMVSGPAAATDGPDGELAAAGAGRGYLAVTAEGMVAGFGVVPDHGDLAEMVLNQPVVDIEVTPSGQGYWLVASDGGVFTFGDAGYYGSAGDMALNQPIVGMAPTPSGQGYWLVASDGGVFTYGDAEFFGSTGDVELVSPMRDLEPSPTGEGYWLVAADGGVFTFGDVEFFGSTGGDASAAATAGMIATPTGDGYWLANVEGAISAFGSAADVNDLVEQGVTAAAGVISILPADAASGALLVTGDGASYGFGGAYRAADYQAADAHAPFVAADLVPDGFVLTLLHNNDGESAISPNEGIGGLAAFAATVAALEEEAMGSDQGTVLVSSGDNFLASAALQASFDKGAPWYDSIGLDAIGYDALAIGNHEFDFGPDSLAEFIGGFEGPAPFLGANLDVSGEPALAALEADGRIAPSTVITVAGRQVGIVGISPPYLAEISSPGAVVIDQDTAGVIQTEVDALTADGVEVIVVISHLQDVDADRALAGELTGVDIVVAGGGDEILANDDDELAPGDMAAFPYPIIETNADGQMVPVVTTSGDYTYVGRLMVTFDAEGNLVSVDDESGPVLVKTENGVDADIQAQVVDPIEAYEAGLAATAIASSEVELESDRGNEFGTDAGKRVQETNLGNLVADSLLWQAQQVAADFGVDSPQVAIQNGGGIRNDDFSDGATTPFDITLLDTFDTLPFANFVTVIEDMTGAELEAVLEHAYGELPGSNGGFAQVAGMEVTVVFDPAAAPGDGSPNPSVDVTDISLGDGTPILVANVDQGVTVDLATIDFLANGGDGYPFPEARTTTSLGVTYQQSLRNFLEAPAADGGLEGTVAAADYPVVPVGGGARIMITAI